jgi:diguanylate cyclase (GGDEF)-like protein/PAS domain S-box-containing protein
MPTPVLKTPLQWLWLAVALFNGIVIGLAVHFLETNRQVHEAGAYATTQNLALAMEREITGIFATVNFSLRTLVDDYAEKRQERHFPLQEWNDELRRQRSYLPILSGLRGADANGRVIWGLSPGDPQAATVADRDYFIVHRDNPNLDLFISEPILARISRQWSILLSRRLNNPDGSFAGIVAASIPLNRFSERFASMKLGKNGSIGLRDARLRLMVRYPELAGGGQIGSTRIADDFTAALSANVMQGSYRAGTTSIDNVQRFHSYRRNPEFSFYINVGLAEAEYLVPWRNQVRWTIATLALFLLASTLLALWLQRYWKERQHAMERLAQSEADFRQLVEMAPYGLAVVEPDGKISYLNPTLTRILGYAQSDIPDIATWWPKAYPDPAYRESVMEAWRLVLTDHDRESLDHVYSVCDRGGGAHEIRFSVARFQDGRTVVTFDDITERRAAEREVENLAFFDSLTGLPNRRLLLDRLQHSMAASRRSGHQRALLFLDLDHFKQLNDTQGHDVGDRLLVETARRIEDCVREGDTVARLGGDEFVVLLEQLSAEIEEASAQAGMVAEKIGSLLGQPYDLGTIVHHSSCSIGITLFLGQEQTSDEVLKRADMAMYQAKSSGRNTQCFFDPVMQARISAHVALERELRTALARGQLCLHYQPQIDRLGKCIGAEALVRWDHPERGLISPQAFIPVAEECGLIVPLGEQVLRQACTQLAQWQSNPATRTLQLAVNVSVRQFEHADFVAEVCSTLKASKADPCGLKLEITESLLAGNLGQVIEKMQALRDVGVRFALDDFGTGYSSLSYLKTLPINQLKIDRSFVRDITLDPDDEAICRAIIALGGTLGLGIVAEGVETETQWSMLAHAGCNIAQGYLFARPMPAAAFEDWLRQQASVDP